MPLKQLVPEEFCLSCDVCCRFADLHTIWSPLFTDKEIKHLVEKDILPALLFTLPSDSASKNKTKQHKTQRINLLEHKDYFICPCFNPGDSKCKIYDNRPFECVIYPFLLTRKNNKFYLAADKKCPYLGNLKEDEIKSYAEYLKKELQKDKNKTFLKNNPELFTDYPATDLELFFPLKLD
ncbi:MAG: YkgJ family cysteine cluster protein [Candidatus Omnitrophica bacterium]|nr:YkgJ family cysteine cluster protein [Candidatus Omnitrophota bacterium]